SWLLISIWSQEFHITHYAEHGEFAIVAAALAAPALYLAQKQPHGMPLRRTVVALSLIVLMVSLACFAGAFVLTRCDPATSPFKANTGFLLLVSLGAMLVSIWTLFH